MRAERAPGILGLPAAAIGLKAVERRRRTVLPDRGIRRQNSSEQASFLTLIGRLGDRAEERALLGPAA